MTKKLMAEYNMEETQEEQKVYWDCESPKPALDFAQRVIVACGGQLTLEKFTQATEVIIHVETSGITGLGSDYRGLTDALNAFDILEAATKTS